METAEEVYGCEMQCTKPIWLDKYDVLVPCGKCVMCRVARAREWSTRLIHELGFHDKAIFVTLTYENSPDQISKDELQRFFKRLRKSIEPEKISYYACGEYGEKYGRPHYHAIIFGLGFQDEEVIKKSWNKGFIYLGTVTYDSCRYTADYIQKQISGIKKDGKVQPFALMSKGLGKAYAEQNAEKLRRTLSTTIRGKKTGLPRYYQKKLEINTEQLKVRAIEKNKEIDDLHVKRVGNGDQVYDSVCLSRKQAEMNLKARRALKRKGSL